MNRHHSKDARSDEAVCEHGFDVPSTSSEFHRRCVVVFGLVATNPSALSIRGPARYGTRNRLASDARLTFDIDTDYFHADGVGNQPIREVPLLYPSTARVASASVSTILSMVSSEVTMGGARQ